MVLAVVMVVVVFESLLLAVTTDSSSGWERARKSIHLDLDGALVVLLLLMVGWMAGWLVIDWMTNCDCVVLNFELRSID